MLFACEKVDVEVRVGRNIWINIDVSSSLISGSCKSGWNEKLRVEPVILFIWLHIVELETVRFILATKLFQLKCCRRTVYIRSVMSQSICSLVCALFVLMSLTEARSQSKCIIPMWALYFFIPFILFCFTPFHFFALLFASLHSAPCCSTPFCSTEIQLWPKRRAPLFYRLHYKPWKKPNFPTDLSKK